MKNRKLLTLALSCLVVMTLMILCPSANAKSDDPGTQIKIGAVDVVGTVSPDAEKAAPTVAEPTIPVYETLQSATSVTTGGDTNMIKKEKFEKNICQADKTANKMAHKKETSAIFAGPRPTEIARHQAPLGNYYI